MNEHECAVGILYEYEDTDMVTLKTLREEIEIGNKVFGTHETLHNLVVTQCGFKKFDYCPECGKSIDWDKILGEESEAEE